ncbi:hypothetical protein GWI33_022762 [Rhynchophorus ferrugineus]|uniref:Uncharacterized protein n=1 Tax=Rhynchophorus ferrugineus TaxID=354439 RepID=A0A834MKX5_RHYFE|nr:hypothetical protein GWI33_022762 [Rhynchophorus ferrugineus]
MLWPRGAKREALRLRRPAVVARTSKSSCLTRANNLTRHSLAVDATRRQKKWKENTNADPSGLFSPGAPPTIRLLFVRPSGTVLPRFFSVSGCVPVIEGPRRFSRLDIVDEQ